MVKVKFKMKHFDDNSFKTFIMLIEKLGSTHKNSCMRLLGETDDVIVV